MGEETKELQSYSPQGLISQALAQNVPIETLERLMDLQERWQANQAKAAFLRAMSDFQSKCPNLMKSKKVDYPSKSGGQNVKYGYTPLDKITKTIKDVLKECGLSYRWEFEDIDDKMRCWCIVSHVDGHFEKSSMVAGKDSTGNKNDIQSIGSARTYLQRYTLIGALGLSTADEDNDGKTTKPDASKIPEPETDPIIVKANECKTIAEVNKIYSGLTSEQQPKYIDALRKRKEEIKNRK